MLTEALGEAEGSSGSRGTNLARMHSRSVCGWDRCFQAWIEGSFSWDSAFPVEILNPGAGDLREHPSVFLVFSHQQTLIPALAPLPALAQRSLDSLHGHPRPGPAGGPTSH